MSEIAHQDHTEKKAFLVNSSSLKDVRSFCRDVFEKLQIQQDLKDELVLAIAEAAQNIVKHAYQGEDTDDKMEIKISLEKGHLEIGFFDKGRPVEEKNVRHRKIDDIKVQKGMLFEKFLQTNLKNIKNLNEVYFKVWT